MAEEKVSAYLFAVEIDGIESARFQKCLGFEAETEIFEIEEGGFGVHKFKGKTKWSNIVLERGVNENDSIYQWYKQTVEGKIERKTGAIILYDLAGNEIKRWNFYNALPCKWIGPKLNARDPCTFAVERIEIAHEGIVCECENHLTNNQNNSKILKEEKKSNFIKFKMNCFTKETLILTKSGKVPIEKIKIGDYVYTYNFHTQKIDLQKVINTFKHNETDLIIIKIKNEEIRTTAIHPFWIEERGWINAKDLKKGDILKSNKNEKLEVLSVEKKQNKTSIFVYNIEVEKTHTYFIGNAEILVHNKAKIKILRFGKYTIPSIVYHRDIKPAILSQSGDYANIVGGNPDIKVNGNGVITLQATSDEFKGKSLKTNLNFKDFLDEEK